jgi:hypothetical protein
LETIKQVYMPLRCNDFLTAALQRQTPATAETSTQHQCNNSTSNNIAAKATAAAAATTAVPQHQKANKYINICHTMMTWLI